MRGQLIRVAAIEQPPHVVELDLLIGNVHAQSVTGTRGCP